MDPATVAVIWTFIKKFGLPIALILSVAFGVHERKVANGWHEDYKTSVAGRKADRDAYVLATAEAKKKNDQEVADTEAKWKLVVKENADAYQSKLNAAYASVRAYAGRVRTQAPASAQGGAGAGQVPSPTDASGVPYGAGEGALVPVPIGDLNVCAVNTVKAKGWQGFWIGVIQIYPHK